MFKAYNKMTIVHKEYFKMENKTMQFVFNSKLISCNQHNMV